MDLSAAGANDEDVFGGEDDKDNFAPPSLLATASTMDLSFHPQLPLLAAGLVSGEVELFEYGNGVAEKKPLENHFSSWLFKNKGAYSADDIAMYHNHGNMQMHPYGAVTALEFTDDGSYLVSGSSDKTISVLDCVSTRLVIHLSSDVIAEKTSKAKKLNERNKRNDAVDLANQKKKKKFTVTTNPHQHGISAINVCDENLIASGDDDGLIAVWDMRARAPAFTYHEHGDYVSQLLYFTDVSELVSSSGDTCLGVFDVRGGRIRDFSEKRNDELTCFAFINSSGHSSTFIPSILCGTAEGSLPLWKYGSWRRPYDTLEKHPRECEALISFNGEQTTFNHNLVLTGACDGIVRVIQMYPLRRQLCHLSVRDVSQGHTFTSSSSALYRRQNVVIHRERGGDAIRKMRLSFDGGLLAVSGTDRIIDFVDTRFLNDEKAVDALRYRKEQHHIETLREMEKEADAKANKEQLLAEEEAEDDNDSSDDDSDDDDSDDDSSDDGDSDSDDSSDAEPPARKRRQEPLKSSSKSAKQPAPSTEKKKKAKKVEEKEEVDWMEEYKLDRAKKRERVAATKWLKEEKKKKVNFVYEKRRKRSGGFFSEL